MHRGVLFISIMGVQKRYIAKKEVSEVLRAAYDLEGHWQLRLTIKKLREYLEGHWQLRLTIKKLREYY
jgi:hypothetical protein